MIRTFLFLFLSCAIFAQGPLDGYLKGKGHLDLAPSFSFNSASKFAGGDGQLYDVGFKGQLLSVFGEYGLSDRFDLVATAAYVFTSDQSGLQDGGFYAKYRPYYENVDKIGKLGVLFGTGASFPIGKYDILQTGALGQRAVTVPAKLIVQLESKSGIFFNITGGYNWRLDNLKDEDVARLIAKRPNYVAIEPQNYATVLFKIGFPTKQYYLDAWVERQQTKGGANFVEGIIDLPQSYGVSYTQIGGTAYYSENGKRGFYASSGYILGGRNTSKVFRLTLGAVVKM
jgi:hypothetical protein